MHRPICKCLIIALMQPALLIAENALAQENDAGEGQSAKETEEIIVTARRRGESLHDYAGTAAVFDEQTLEEIRIDGLEDIVFRTSNTHFEQRTGSAMNIWIRGAGTSTSGSATNLDTGVALYYDGIYSYIQGSRVPLVFYDMESVEVFKGPQGSLYGRNAVGGAVAAYSARPHHDSESYGSLEFGNYDAWTLEARFNVPVSESSALRFSAYYDEHDSYYKNVDPSIDTPNSEILGGRLRYRFQPGDNLDVILGYENLDEDTEAQTVVPYTFYEDGDEDLTQDTTPTGVDRDTDRWLADISYQINPDVLFRSITGYIETDGFSGTSLSNLPSLNPAITVFLQGTDFKRSSLSQEFLFSSTSGSDFEWLIGGVYFEDEADNDSFQTVNANTSTGITSELNAQTYAVFGDFLWTFDDHWKLGVSLRYTSEERDGRSSSAQLRAPDGTVTSRPDFPYNVDYNKTSPGATLSYQWNDQVMAYLKVATAYQAGGINTRFTAEENAVFGASPATSYEAGLRANLADGRVVTNVTVFKLIQDDYQYRQDLPPANPFQNIGEATTDGVEVELQFRPADWLSIPISFGYMDARITEGDDAFSPDGEGITGQRLRSIPKRTYTIGFDARGQIGSGIQGYARTDFFAARDRYEPFFSVASPDDYEIWNAKVGMEFDNGVNLYVYGENLTDERYVIFEILGAVGISPPRTYGVGFTYRR